MEEETRVLPPLVISNLALVPILEAIVDERQRQNAKWGIQNHPDGTGSLHDKREASEAKILTDLHDKDGTVTWRHILREEVYEAFAEHDTVLLREELVQVAAVAAAWIEDIDRREVPK